jgi:hypothetical protein
LKSDETVFIGTTKGLWILFRRVRENTTTSLDEDDITDFKTKPWIKLENAKQYNSERYGEKEGFIREHKIVFSLTDNFVANIELDREKHIVVVLTKGKGIF